MREDRACACRPLKAVGRTLPGGLGDLLHRQPAPASAPVDAQLIEVGHGDGRLSVTVLLEDIDEPLTWSARAPAGPPRRHRAGPPPA